jgi:proline iminopeptidase
VFPGGPGFGYEIYEAHSGCFAEDINMLFFDPIGCGRSSKASAIADYTFDNYTKNVKSLISHFGMKKVCILGTSYGSMAALNFAIRYPDNLDKLILVAGASSYHFREAAKQKLSARGTPEQKLAGEKVLAGREGFKTSEELANYFQMMAPLYSHKAKREGAAPYKAMCSIEPLNFAITTQFEKFDYRACIRSTKKQLF